MSQSLTVEQLVAELGAWTHREGSQYVKLADAISDAAAQAGLEPGTRLPAERRLATHLSLSRGTVIAAYGALAERGIVERRQGSGTTIADGATMSQRRPEVRHHRSSDLTRRVSGVRVDIDLSLASPDFDPGLVARLAAAAPQVLARAAPGQGYAPLGLPELREGVAARLCTRGIPTTPDQVMITPGAQGALQLIVSAFVRRGDRAVVESPTYGGAIECLSRAGAVITAIPLDHAGPRLDLFARAVEQPDTALALLVPTCHNPTGSIMSEQRRREVLRHAERAGHALLVEDLTLADLAIDGAPPPDLAALAPERVIAIGSFSKTVWGGLRTGFIRADAATILRLGRLKAAHDLGCGMLDQAACVAALPELDASIARLRATTAARDAALRTLLAEHLPEWEPAPCLGGYGMWIRTPGVVGDHVIAAALRHGVALASGSAGAPDERHLDRLRICFSEDIDVLAEAVARLRVAYDEVLAATAAGSSLTAATAF